MQTLFHLAMPVHNLERARWFYGEVLGCAEGRSSEQWVDFNLHGHQFVAHLCGESQDVGQNPVDGDSVPVPHFGLILEWQAWEQLVARLQAYKVEFIFGPRVRFKGKIGEQGTLFVRDPSGNALEFKSFRDFSQIFAREDTDKGGNEP